MAAKPLSDDLKAAGLEMLGELDRVGLGPQGALWLYAHYLGDWRYAVVSDLVNALGRHRLYDLIGTALDRIGPIHGLTIFDVHLFDTSETMPQVLSAIRVDGGAATITDCIVNGMLTDAYVYRLVPSRNKREVRLAAKAFERSVQQLIAA